MVQHRASTNSRDKTFALLPPVMGSTESKQLRTGAAEATAAQGHRQKNPAKRTLIFIQRVTFHVQTCLMPCLESTDFNSSLHAVTQMIERHTQLVMASWRQSVKEITLISMHAHTPKQPQTHILQSSTNKHHQQPVGLHLH
jgi:hypothetical protein